MKTIKEAAESAAKEVFPQLCTGLSEDTVEFYKARDVLARHFADYAALRDAAERAENNVLELTEVGNDMKDAIWQYLHASQAGAAPDDIYAAISRWKESLRGLLNTQPTKET